MKRLVALLAALCFAVSVHAGSLTLLGAGSPPAGGGGGGGATLAIATAGAGQGTHPGGANTVSFTVSTTNGAGSTARTLAIEWAADIGSTNSISGATLGGVAMTSRTVTTGANRYAGIFTLDITSGSGALYTGTTATLVFTATGSFAINGIEEQPYEVTGGVPTTYAAATPVNQVASPQSVAFTVPTGGVGMANAYGFNASTTVTGATKDSQTISTTGGTYLTAAHTTTTGAQTVTFTNPADTFSVVGLSIGP